MKKGRIVFLIVLCLALIVPVCAMAQETAVLGKISSERMYIPPVPGLVFENKFEDGYMHILIDTDATNWGKVMLNSGATTDVQLMGYVYPPDPDATKLAYITGNAWKTDEAILSNLREETSFNPGPSGISRSIAAYTEEKQILSPVRTNGSDNRFIHAIHWTNNDGSRHWYEYMEIEFEHTSMLGRKVEQLKYDHELLQTNTNFVPNVTKTDVADGVVSYSFNPSGLDLEKYPSVQTRLKAPAGAAYMLARDEYGGSMRCTVETDGYASFNHSLTYGINNPIVTGVRTERRSILWYDSNDTIVEESGVLAFTLINADSKEPWMAYLDQYEKKAEYASIPWTPVTFGQYDILYGYEQDDRLVDVDYFTAEIGSHGHVHTRLKKDVDVNLDIAQELSWCGITYVIHPPKDAVYFTHTRNTRNNFYGVQPDAYSHVIASLMSFKTNPEEFIKLEYPEIMDGCPLFEPLSTPLEDVMIYSTVPETKPDFAGAYFYCWFDKDRQPISISYFIETADRIVLEPETESYETEVDVKHPVKGPVFIDGKNTGWKLRAEYHVQSGTNAYIVDLHIEDKHGNPVDLKKELGEGEKIVFYLPYREHEDFSKYNFFLTHYEGGNFNRGVSVDVTPTDKGIRFEVDNLSPFVVSWEDPDLPPTMTTQLEGHIVTVEPLREPTPELKAAGFDTKEAIEAAMLKQAAQAMPAGINAQMKVYEFVPQKYLQEDKEWMELWMEVYPAEGLYCKFSYPTGTSAATHDFAFKHMLGENCAEGKAGDIVTIPHWEKDDHILLFMQSCSPVSYVIVETPAAPAVPPTGDNTPIILYLSVLCLSAIGYAFIMRRKMHG